MRAAQSLGGLLVVSLLLGCASQVAPLTDGGASGGAATNVTSGSVTAGVSGTVGTGGATSGAASSGGITGGTNSTGGGTTSGVAGMTGGTGGTSGDAGLLNQPCTVDNGIDPCVAVGLVCLYSSDPAHVGTVCSIPAEFQPCGAYGCNDPSLHCMQFYAPYQGWFCLFPCVNSDACPALYTSCQGGTPGECYFNSCNTTSDGGFFTFCDVPPLGTGTCLPTSDGGVCLQGGTANAGAVCSTQRGVNVSDADLCGVGAVCVPGETNGVGHCAPLCGLDGGPSCPSPTFCQPSGSGDWGYCL
jgi:hypothetical protein